MPKTNCCEKFHKEHPNLFCNCSCHGGERCPHGAKEGECPVLNCGNAPQENGGEKLPKDFGKMTFETEPAQPDKGWEERFEELTGDKSEDAILFSNGKARCSKEAIRKLISQLLKEAEARGYEKAKKLVERVVKADREEIKILKNEASLSAFEEIINEWIKQGRPEEAIWGVKNFLSGLGGVKLRQEIAEAERRVEERYKREYEKRGGDKKLKEIIHETVAQARQDLLAEIEKFVESKRKYPEHNAISISDVLSFIKENKNEKN